MNYEKVHSNPFGCCHGFFRSGRKRLRGRHHACHYKAVDTTLSVTVDYTIEGLYFDGTTLKSSATNGYYPFNFSFIVSDRTAVGSITVSNGGSFAWASDSEDSETGEHHDHLWSGHAARPPLPR